MTIQSGPERLSVSSQGVQLAVYRWSNPGKPRLLLVHGYPDNHEVWLPLVHELRGDFEISCYDVRGAGASEHPASMCDYRLPILAQDLEAVLDTVSPDQPVHLAAHDWGSIQTWEGVTEPHLQSRLASYTTLSGPCLDHAGYWMRDHLLCLSPRKWLIALRQLVKSWYIYLFHLPLLPEFAWRKVLGRAWPYLLEKVQGLPHPVPVNPTQVEDGCYGVKLYRANFFQRLLMPRIRTTQIPIQLVVLNRDHFVDAGLFNNLTRWAPNLSRRDLTMTHWEALAKPQQLAAFVREFVQGLANGAKSPT